MVQEQGQGLINWSSKILEDKDFHRAEDNNTGMNDEFLLNLVLCQCHASAAVAEHIAVVCCQCAQRAAY